MDPHGFSDSVYYLILGIPRHGELNRFSPEYMRKHPRINFVYLGVPTIWIEIQMDFGEVTTYTGLRF